MSHAAWTALSRADDDDIWMRVTQRLGFRPSINPKDFPGFDAPAPSVTYSFADIWGDGFAQREADLQDKAAAVFKAVTPKGAFLYALDWQHPCYRFYPHAVDNAPWTIPALPDGDYYLFVEKSLAFGWLGHPWEQTICVFGAPLLAALQHHRPKVFKDPIRRSG